MSDDDEEMADLFSFGSAENPGSTGESSDHGTDANMGSDPSLNRSGSMDINSTSGHSGSDSERNVRKNTSDSFMDMIGSSSHDDEILGGMTFETEPTTPTTKQKHDKETQEMLDWLESDSGAFSMGDEDVVVFVEEDDDDNNSSSMTKKSPLASSSLSSSPTAGAAGAASSLKKPTPSQASPKASPKKPPPASSTVATLVELPPVFTSLSEAMASSKATLQQIKSLAQKTPLADLDDHAIRPDLYCRLICGNKTLEQTVSSSLADSFAQWQIPKTIQAFWIPKAAQYCSETMLSKPAAPASISVSQSDLVKLLAYYNSTRSKDDGDSSSMDVLVPCVAATLLAAGIPVAATSVVLAQVQALYMPLLALGQDERWEAALSLHHALYLLAAYHLPLLVVHLDRYVPGWFGPRKMPRDVQQQQQQEAEAQQPPSAATTSVTERARHLDEQGQIPPSWLLSFLSGQVFDSHNNLPIRQVLRLWDAQLTQGAQYLRFFLTLAVLERVADQLILSTGDALHRELQQAFEFTEEEDGEWFDEWMPAAEALFRATPVTVLKQLRKTEDEAVQLALKARQERAEAALKARLQAEAAAHAAAQEKKADEARMRLTRARLVAFYRKHAPDKEANIDKILVNYADRLEVLDLKLYNKYGESFHPALKPKTAEPKKSPQNQQSLHNRSASKLFGRGRSNDSSDSDANSSSNKGESTVDRKPDQVSVLVKASEVLPIVCWAKGGSPAPNKLQEDGGEHTELAPLKYFLVDSRSEEAAAEQGRFPTAVSLSPEVMLDPERVMEHEDRFEALRGAVHICVMGSGFSAIPSLYKQKLSPNLEAAMLQDESTTNICALFFIKKGFPFVSVLDGGFAAAHSWLVRKGSEHDLKPSSVLVDYDPEASVFGQMETLHNASATEKAQRQLSNLLETSLVAMTIQAQRLEKLANEMEAKKNKNAGSGTGLRLGAFFKGAASVNKSDTASSSNEVAKPQSSQGDASEPPPPAASSTSDDENKKSNSTTPNTAFRKSFRNPFRAKSPDEGDNESNPTKSPVPVPLVSSSSSSTSPAPDGSAIHRSITPPRKLGLASLVRSKSHDADEPPPPPPIGNSVSKSPKAASTGGSSALGNSSTSSNGQQQQPGFLKMNPFRFGGGGGKDGNRSSHGVSNRSNHGAMNTSSHNSNNNKAATHRREKSTGGFAGFNNLRRTALGRIRSAPANKDQAQQEKTLTEEESISFD